MNMMIVGAPVEAVVHAILRVTGDMPGCMGRLRVARVVSGFAITGPDDETVARLARYSLDDGWPLKRTVELVDALLDGGLLAQTVGPRPTLALTRSGFRALEALEGSGELRGDVSDAMNTICGCD